MTSLSGLVILLFFFNEPADKGYSTVIKSYSEKEGPGDEKVG